MGRSESFRRVVVALLPFLDDLHPACLFPYRPAVFGADSHPERRVLHHPGRAWSRSEFALRARALQAEKQRPPYWDGKEPTRSRLHVKSIELVDDPRHR